jgi:hypothetical protein
MAEMLYRPLWMVEKLVGLLNMEITYAYDDLVFVEHSNILFQFDEDDHELLRLYVHKDAAVSGEPEIVGKLFSLAEENAIRIKRAGNFYLNEKKESEEIDIVFC